MLVSAGTEGIVVWDIESGEQLVKIEEYMEPVLAMFSPDGSTIAAVGMSTNDEDDGPNDETNDDGDTRAMCHLLDAESGALRFSMVGHQSDVNAATFSVDPNP